MFLKKRSILQLTTLLLVAAFVIVVGACPADNIFTKRVEDINADALEAKIAEATTAKASIITASAATEVNLGSPWVTSEELATFNAAIEAAKQVVQNATTQAEVDSAVTVLTAAISAFNSAKTKTGTKATLILTELNNKITEAHTAKIGVSVDDAAGNVPLGESYVTPDEMSTFNTAISAAETARTVATQAEVNSAVITLNTAIETFKDAKKTGSKISGFSIEQLEELIATAKAARVGVVTNTAPANVAQGINWVTTEVMTAFDNAITNAESALTGSATEVDSAVLALSDAISTFAAALQQGTKVDYDQLTTLIASAKAAKGSTVVNTTASNVDFGEYWVIQTVMTAFDTAISAAEAALSATTQAAVNTAVTDLTAAITTFTNARQTGTKVNTGALNALIIQALDTKTGVVVDTASANVPQGEYWVTQTVMTTFNNAITAAEYALGATTQVEVNTAVTTLTAAITTFKSAKTEGTKSAGPTSIDYGTTLNWGNTVYTPNTLGLSPGDTTTEINVNWLTNGNTNIDNKSTYVRFIEGTKNAGYALKEATGIRATATSSTAVYHGVTVEGLVPGKSYQYSVSIDGINWSSMYDYKVPVATGTWKFAVMSDSQINATSWDTNNRYNPTGGRNTPAGWLETMAKIAAADVSFIVSCGDQIDTISGTTGPAGEYTSFFAPPALRSLPLAPVVGNHDTSAHIRYHFNLPNDPNARNSDTKILGNYYYLYNNILFVGLNTGADGTYNNWNRTQAAPYITRFETTIKNAKIAHPKYDWLIVQHHKSTASVGDHLADLDVQAYVEAGFERLMSDQGVDFVLAGHDHVYARSYPLAGKDGGKVSVPDKTHNPASGSTWTGVQDPIYLTFTTASGLKYYAVSSDTAFKYDNTLYVKNNAAYPYLGDSKNGDEAEYYGSTEYMTNKRLPVSNAAYVQPYIPSYTVVEVSNNPTGTKSITFKTYPIATASGTSSGATTPYSYDANIPYDTITVTK